MKRFNWNVTAGNDNIDEWFNSYQEALKYAKSIKDNHEIVNVWRHDTEFDYENCGDCEGEFELNCYYENGKFYSAN